MNVDKPFFVVDLDLHGMKLLSQSTQTARDTSLLLFPYSRDSPSWITFQYLEPYSYLNKLPAGLLYIHNAPPGLGRTSVINTLSSTHDILVSHNEQLWFSHPEFPYSKDTLILHFNFAIVPNNVEGVFDRVSIGIHRFLVKYGKLLGFNREVEEQKFRQITAKGLSSAIPLLMEMLRESSQRPLICLIDSYDDIALAAWCIYKTGLQGTIDDLHLFFHQLSSFLTRDDGRGLRKIFAFGSTGLNTLFTGIPLQDLTGDSNLTGLFGLRSSELNTIVQKTVGRESHREKALINLRTSCPYYTFHDQDGSVSEPVFYLHNVVSRLKRSSSEAASENPVQKFLTKNLCRFVKDKLRQKQHFTSHLQHLLAFEKQSIDTTHLLDDDNLSPALLKSFLVDFGLYKASFQSEIACYIPHQADLLKLPTNLSAELIVDRVLQHLEMFPARAANLRSKESLQLSLRWLFPHIDMATSVSVYHNKENGFADVLIITDDAYFVIQLMSLTLDSLNKSPKEILDAPDLSKLSYSSNYPPGRATGRRLKKSQYFNVGELLKAGADEAHKYAEAIRVGGSRFSVEDNRRYVTISPRDHTRDIPILPLAILLLGGTRILFSHWIQSSFLKEY